MSTSRHFDEEEKRYIIEHWGNSTAGDIAKHLGRSSSGIRKKARSLGCEMRECRRWTKEEDLVLLGSRGRSLSAMAKQLGRLTSECSARARVLGIDSWAYHKNGGKFKSRRGYIVSGFTPRNGEGKTRTVFEHHVVMEERIGRNLLPGEVVHHVNGIKDDNRSENLHLCKDASAHRKAHCSIELLLPHLIQSHVVFFDAIEGVYRLCKTDK